MRTWGVGKVAVVAVAVATIGGGTAVAQASPMGGRAAAHCRQTVMQAMQHEHPGMLGAKIHMEMPGPGSCDAFRPSLPSSGFTATASSAAAGHPASAALSGGRSFWRSARLTGRRGLPQTITIALHRTRAVSGLRYLPPSGSGEIGRFVVSLSRDGRRFGPAVARGRWQNNGVVKQVGWSPRFASAVRVRILSASPVGAAHVGAARITLTGVRAAGGGAHAHASSSASTNPAVVGSWGPTIGFPIIPVAAALVPGNKLVVWSADGAESFSDDSAPYTQTAVYDLTTGAVSQSTVTNTGHNMFCPGVSILANGDLLVTGGIGDTDTSIYDVATGTWSAGPQMNIGRGYQGQTTLSDGDAFTLGGSWSGAVGGKNGEVYTPGGSWRVLQNVPATPIYTNDVQGAYRADNHGWFIASSGDSVFQAGPSQEMHWISTAGQGTIAPAAARGSAGDEMNGNAVLYDVGKILTAGGAPEYGTGSTGSNATTAANVVDISGGPGSTPTVTPTAPLNIARGFENSVALPNGNVFTVGGETYPIPFDDATSVMTPELWSPTTGAWREMAPQAEPRNYHSVAVLLPDGRVFSGGGGLCGSCATNHPDGQIWSPPYLYNADGSPATRPRITSAPSSASTGQTISVTTDSPVSSFALMRYGESTHSVDNDQRRIPLTISSADCETDTDTMTIPSDPGVVLPGPYMLFAINAQGTPSLAATVMVSSASPDDPWTGSGSDAPVATGAISGHAIGTGCSGGTGTGSGGTGTGSGGTGSGGTGSGGTSSGGTSSGGTATTGTPASGGGPVPTTRSTIAVGGHLIALSTTAPNVCLAPSARLQAAIGATAIAGSIASRLTFVTVGVYVDRGVRHVTRRAVRRHGRTVTVTRVSFAPNRLLHRLPAHLSLPLSGLARGRHTLTIRARFRVVEHEHTSMVTRTLTHRFRVCPG